jgi:hypothetical protein
VTPFAEITFPLVSPAKSIIDNILNTIVFSQGEFAGRRLSSGGFI